MPGKWYRGEAAGVGPGKPGGLLHDFGDGLYLTDREPVASLYAETRALEPGSTGTRVYEVRLGPSDLGTVLDLTADPRWANFMARPIAPGTGHANLEQSRLEWVKLKNELYHQYFEEFLLENKINIDLYDSVIGPEYVRGGKQLCIRFRGGAPSSRSLAVRKMLRPRLAAGEFEFTSPAEWTPRINVSLRSVRVRPGLRSAASTAGEVAITLGIAIGLALLEYWMTKRAIEQKFQEGMKAVGPKIVQRIQAAAPDIARLQLKMEQGEKVYANAVVQVIWNEYSAPRGGGTYTEPEVLLADLYVATRRVERDRSFEAKINVAPRDTWNRDSHALMASRKIDEYTRPYEVAVYSDEELDEFRTLTAAYLEAKRHARMDPYDDLSSEAVRELRDQIAFTYGPDVWALNVD